MAKGRRTYRRKSMRRMRRQRGGLPGDGKRFGRPCDSATDWFCSKNTPQIQQESDPLKSIGQGLQSAVGSVSTAAQGAYNDVANDISNINRREGVPSQQQLAEANTNLYNQQSRQYGGRRRRSTRRRKQSRRRTASRRR